MAVSAVSVERASGWFAWTLCAESWRQKTEDPLPSLWAVGVARASRCLAYCHLSSGHSMCQQLLFVSPCHRMSASSSTSCWSGWRMPSSGVFQPDPLQTQPARRPPAAVLGMKPFCSLVFGFCWCTHPVLALVRLAR